MRLYSNIKEVEIRRTIWDRILGMGVVVIYTNAENRRNNGLVVYALDNPKEDYEFIDKIVNKYRADAPKQNKVIEKKEEKQEERTELQEEVSDDKAKAETEKTAEEIMQKDIEKEKNEQSFKDSLKETN